MQLVNYTHKGVEFWKGEGLNIYLKQNDLFPAPLVLNNGSPGWRLSRKVRLSVRQLKKLTTAPPAL